jgi:hypothetical protein
MTLFPFSFFNTAPAAGTPRRLDGGAAHLPYHKDGAARRPYQPCATS